MIVEILEQSNVPCWLKGGHWTTNNVLRILRKTEQSKGSTNRNNLNMENGSL